MDLGDLNVVQQMAGKLDSALKSLRRAVEILDRLDRQYPGVLNYQGGLAGTYNMMSDLHRRRREPAESLAFAEKARALLDRLVAEHPKDIYSRIDLAKAHNNIGRVHQQSGDPVEALRSFQRAVDLYESLPELDPRNSYNLACNVALVHPLDRRRERDAGHPQRRQAEQGRSVPPREVRRPGVRAPPPRHPGRVPQPGGPRVRPRPRRDPRPGRLPGADQGGDPVDGGCEMIEEGRPTDLLRTRAV